MSLLNTIVKELWFFGLKQAYACLFGGFLLLIMMVTSVWYPLESLHRYDFIFLSAVVFQVVMLVFKLETWREAAVILVFHVVATGMELFKTSDSIGSWTYPEEAIFKIANVPLFTGFLYSAVGSYIARVSRIFDFQYNRYPNKMATLLLVSAIYVNFFTHHYIVDVRWLLLAVTFVLFWRVDVYFKVDKLHRHMPLLLGWLLVALFIWIAENIGTLTGVWLYPNQKSGWELVSFDKLLAWYLLMLLSFVLVSLIHRPAI
ncbi:DUF817 domain-containing protein, partial [bacterium]|nr:DUF817 domain-containing protein [bacterium]